MHLIIGTYTEPLPHADGKADGILVTGYDTASGRFGGEVRTLAGARNPSYVTLSRAGDRLYAVCESDTFEGQPGGGLLAFARDPRTCELTRLNARPTRGESPCHVALADGGRFVITANYGEDAGSVTVYPAAADGRLGDLADHVVHTGSGPNTERQASSHAHMIASDPATGAIMVADLGADTIFVYEVGATGRLTPAGQLKATPGTGPRHLAFHPDGLHLFVANELDSTVSVWRRDTAGFTAVATASSVPSGGQRGNLPAAIRVSPAGRHVLVSNRGHDSIAVFRFDAGTSDLELAGVTPAEGACPRDFILTADGRRLVLASQDSDLLASYEFDDANGTLGLLDASAAPTPVCLALALPADTGRGDRDPGKRFLSRGCPAAGRGRRAGSASRCRYAAGTPPRAPGRGSCCHAALPAPVREARRRPRKNRPPEPRPLRAAGPHSSSGTPITTASATGGPPEARSRPPRERCSPRRG